MDGPAVTAFYARDGRPLTLMEWAALCNDDEYRHVALDRIVLEDGDVEFLLSTVWLGLDHFLGLDDAPPLYFETMLFGSEGECWRWPNEAAALAGHDRILTALRAGDMEGAG